MFLVGVVVGGAIVFTLHETHALPSTTVRQVRAFSEVQEPLAGTLADRFRPWLLFDSKEPWRPLNVDDVLDEGTHSFCTASAEHRLSAGSPARRSSTPPDAGRAGSGERHQAGFRRLVQNYHGPARCGGVLLDCGTGGRRPSTTT